MGGDINISVGLKPATCFNPRPRMGGDAWFSFNDFMLFVSIHAPAWGATGFKSNTSLYKTCFNPRPRMGGDLRMGEHWKNKNKFQSTPPHGGRPLCLILFVREGRFQSTPPHGGRHNHLLEQRKTVYVSIHAPAWGATFLNCKNQESCFVSIHAPAWGATLAKQDGEWHLFVSIHAPAWGATKLGQDGCAIYLFQSTPPHGGRRWLVWYKAAGMVSIHAPAWGATNERKQLKIF